MSPHNPPTPATEAPHPAAEAATVPSLRILGSRIDRLTAEGALQRIRAMASSGRPHHVITGNTLMVLAAQTDTALRQIIENAALVVPESWGVFWASGQVDAPLLEFTPGIDLMMRLCEQARRDGHGIFLLGAAPGVATLAAERLRARFPGLQITGTHHGFFAQHEDGMIVSRVRAAAPHYLFVALNVPGQEKWIARNVHALGVPVVMGVGGSFDVLSGRLKRAPMWMRRAGIEWVYRTLQQPWRLKRIKDLPVFMWRVLVEKERTRA